MNGVNIFLLRLVMLPAGFYSRMGVNVAQLRAILIAKLIIDDRRPNTFQQARRRKSKGPVSGATLSTMLVSLVFGLFFLFSFLAGVNEVTHLFFYFTFYLLILALTLISDFTSVLIDVKDSSIILPKPVNDRTFLLSKLLHIGMHLFKMAGALSLPGIVFIAYTRGAGAMLAFVFILFFVILFAVFIINAVYLLVLKITTPARFQSFISYFQIAFTVFIVAGRRLVFLIIPQSELLHFDITVSAWRWLIPPFWFAGGGCILSSHGIDTDSLFCLLLGVCLPVFCVWLVVGYFAPAFNRKLAASGIDNLPAAAPQKKGARGKQGVGFSQRLAGWFCKNSTERMAFLFTWKMTARSRDFRLKVYPSIGYILIFFIFNLLNHRSGSAQSLSNGSVHAKFNLLSIIYFGSFISITAIEQSAFSEQYKAAWIYFVTPVRSPGFLLSGAIKSNFFKFYLPVFLLISVIGIAMMGVGLIPNLIFGLFNQLFILSLISYYSMKRLPFSTKQELRQRSGVFMKTFSTLFIFFIIGAIHYFVFDYPWVVLFLSLLSIIPAWLILDGIQGTGWEKINVNYSEE